MKKYLAVPLALLSAGSLAACGSSTKTSDQGQTSKLPPPTPLASPTTPKPTPEPVKLHAPHDHTVTGETYVLSGAVAPANSTVLIEDETVPVHHGHWSETVKLDHGINNFTIDAAKSGHGNDSAFVTITRNWTPAEREAQRQAREAKKAAQEANYKGRAVTIPYNELNKDADAQAGKIVTYTGQIFQIQEDPSGGGIMLVSVTDEGYGLWTDHIWVNYSGHIPQNEGDKITVWGKVEGSKSYETQSGGRTYVPEVTAKYTS